MILVDYRGKDDVKYLYVSMKQDLIDAIEWLQFQLTEFDRKKREAGSIIEYKGDEL